MTLEQRISDLESAVDRLTTIVSEVVEEQMIVIEAYQMEVEELSDMMRSMQSIFQRDIRGIQSCEKVERGH